jgi:chloramphenicol O-acetyltransferase type A
MKHFVDIESWERRDNYKNFANFLSSWYGMTAEVECKRAYEKSHELHQSFFIYYLYAILRAANEVKEFRYRTDINKNIVYYDTIDILTPIAVPGRTFYTVRIKYIENFNEFYRKAHETITNIPENGNPYEADQKVYEKGDYDVILLSAIPKLHFTSITFSTLKEPGNAFTFPLMNAGKAMEQNGKLMMPIALTVNHQFVDGAHITSFYEKVEFYLNTI